MTPVLLKPCPTDAISDSAENLRKLSALRAEVSGQSGGNDASLLSCFSSTQAPYPSFPPKAAKTRSFRCGSSSHRTRFAGLRREPCFVLRRAEKAPENPPRNGSESFSGAGTLPHLEGGHTAAHRGKHGGYSACSASFCCTCCRSAAASAIANWRWWNCSTACLHGSSV